MSTQCATPGCKLAALCLPAMSCRRTCRAVREKTGSISCWHIAASLCCLAQTATTSATRVQRDAAAGPSHTGAANAGAAAPGHNRQATTRVVRVGSVQGVAVVKAEANNVAPPGEHARAHSHPGHRWHAQPAGRCAIESGGILAVESGYIIGRCCRVHSGQKCSARREVQRVPPGGHQLAVPEELGMPKHVQEREKESSMHGIRTTAAGLASSAGCFSGQLPSSPE